MDRTIPRAHVLNHPAIVNNQQSSVLQARAPLGGPCVLTVLAGPHVDCLLSLEVNFGHAHWRHNCAGLAENGAHLSRLVKIFADRSRKSEKMDAIVLAGDEL